MVSDDDEVSLHHHRCYTLTAGEPLQLRDKLWVHLQVYLFVLDSIVVQIVQQRVGIGAVGPRIDEESSVNSQLF